MRLHEFSVKEGVVSRDKDEMQYDDDEASDASFPVTTYSEDESSEVSAEAGTGSEAGRSGGSDSGVGSSHGGEDVHTEDEGLEIEAQIVVPTE